MSGQSILLNLPDDLYRRLTVQARLSHRSLEEEVLRVVATSVTPETALSKELDDELSQLEALSDDALWLVARSHLSSRDAARLEALHSRRQRDGLTAREANTLDELVRRYERFMLVRARSAVLLRQRGYNVSTLVP